MSQGKFLPALARLTYHRKVFGLLAVGSREVTSLRLRLPVGPDRLDLYRSLLPPGLAMPRSPRIYFYLSEFNGTFPKKIAGGYREAAVCLKAACPLDAKTDPDKGGWYPLTMPVSDPAALKSGLIMGYPKYMADISLVRDEGSAGGTVKAEGKDVFSMDFQKSELTVPDLDEEEMDVPFYLSQNGRINIMSNEVVARNSFTCLTGTVAVKIASGAGWTGLLQGNEVQGPGVLKHITGQFNLTRRSR